MAVWSSLSGRTVSVRFPTDAVSAAVRAAVSAPRMMNDDTNLIMSFTYSLNRHNKIVWLFNPRKRQDIDLQNGIPKRVALHEREFDEAGNHYHVFFCERSRMENAIDICPLCEGRNNDCIFCMVEFLNRSTNCWYDDDNPENQQVAGLLRKLSNSYPENDGNDEGIEDCWDDTFPRQYLRQLFEYCDCEQAHTLHLAAFNGRHISPRHVPTISLLLLRCFEGFVRSYGFSVSESYPEGNINKRLLAAWMDENFADVVPTQYLSPHRFISFNFGNKCTCRTSELLPTILSSRYLRNDVDLIISDRIPITLSREECRQASTVNSLVDALLGANTYDKVAMASFSTSFISSIVAYWKHGDFVTLTSMLSNITTLVTFILARVDESHKLFDITAFFKQKSLQEWKDFFLNSDGLEVQQSTSDVVMKVVCLVVSLLTLCSADFLISKMPSLDNLIKSVSKLSGFYKHGVPMITELEDFFGEILFGVSSPHANIRNRAAELTKECDELSLFPIDQIFSAQYKFSMYDALIKKASDFATSCSRGETYTMLLLSSIAHLKERRTKVAEALKSSKMRQVPNCFIFYGEKGIGKTTAKNYLAQKISQSRYNGGDEFIFPLEPGAKYFPNYAGQPILVSQELMKSKDLTGNVLVHDLTSILSSEPYQMPSAYDKEQFCSFETLLLDTNSDPFEMKNAIGAVLVPQTLDAWFDRPIFVKTVWALDPCLLELPRNERPMKEDFSHLYFIPHIASKNGFAPLPTSFTEGSLTISELEKICKEIAPNMNWKELMVAASKDTRIFEAFKEKIPTFRFHHSLTEIENFENRSWRINRQNHIGRVEAAALLKAARENKENKQAERHHFVVNIYGPPGCGKTESIVKEISTAFRAIPAFANDVYSFEEAVNLQLNKRSVIIADDTFLTADQEKEKLYVDFYNRRLPNGSFIIFVSNFSPSTSYTYSWQTLIPSIFSVNKSIFTLPAMYRRAGFDGSYYSPDKKNIISCFNEHFYQASGSGIVRKDASGVGNVVLPGDFAKEMVIAYAKYLSKGFTFRTEVVVSLPISNPTFSLRARSIDVLRSTLSTATGKTKLLLFNTDEMAMEIAPMEYEKFMRLDPSVLAAVPRGTPVEIMQFYTKIMRSFGIEGDIYIKIEELGECLMVGNTVYTTVPLEHQPCSITIENSVFTLNGVNVSEEDIFQFLASSSVSTFAKFPTATTSDRRNIENHIFQDEKLKGRFVNFLLNNPHDEKFDVYTRSKVMEFLRYVPWIAGVGAFGYGLYALIKGTLTTPTREEIKLAVATKIAAQNMGIQFKDTPQMASNPLYWEEYVVQAGAKGARIDLKEEDDQTGKTRRVIQEKFGRNYTREEIGRASQMVREELGSDMQYVKDPADFAGYVRDVLEGLQAYSPRRATRLPTTYNYWENVIKKNMVFLDDACWGLGICENYILAPAHMMNVADTITVHDDRISPNIKLTASICRTFKDRDFVVLRINEKTSLQFKDIRKHFAGKEYKVQIMPVAVIKPTPNNELHFSGHAECYNEGYHKYLSAYTEPSRAYYTCVFSGPERFQMGDCGLAYISATNNPWILGIHTSAAEHLYSSCTAVFYDDLVDLGIERQQANNRIIQELAEKLYTKEDEDGEPVFYDCVEELRPEPIKLGKNKIENTNMIRTPFSDEPLVPLDKYVSICRDIITAQNSQKPIYDLSSNRCKQLGTLPASLVMKPDNKHMYFKRGEYNHVKNVFGSPKRVPVRLPSEVADCEDLPFNSRGERSQVMYNVQFLTKDIVSNVDKITAEFVVQELATWLQVRHGNSFHYLTDQQAINGIHSKDIESSFANLRCLDMSSSSGLFSQICLGASTKGQLFEMKDGFYVWRENNKSTCARQLFNQIVEDTCSGLRPLHLTVTCHKKELLPREKAHKGRTFDYFDVSFTLAERKLMGAFLGSLSTNDPDHPVAVGMDSGRDWNERFSRHSRFKFHGSIDYTKYDKIFNREIVNILISSFRSIYYSTTDTNAKKWCFSTITLIKALFSSNRLIGNTIYEVSYSMPSGTAATAPLNSLLNLVIIYYSVCVILGPIPYTKFLLLFKVSAYGDDIFLSWSEEVGEEFDMIKLADTITKHFGMKVDSDKKDGKILSKTTHMEDLSFLSRTPTLVPGIGWLALLKKESILGPLYFAKKNQMTPDAFFRELRRAMEEGAKHGAAFYSKLLELHSKVSAMHPGIAVKYYPLSYAEQMRNMFQICTFDKIIKDSDERQELRQSKTMEVFNPNNHITTGPQATNAAQQQQQMLMRMEGGGAALGKMVTPHTGMSQAEMLVQPGMMNNAQLVDDKNDTTASQMNSPQLMQQLPPRFMIDIWSALFTSNLFINRVALGAATPIGFTIFEYSSDVNSPEFPSSSNILAFIKALISGHKFYVSDFRIKVKLIGAAGTIGRIIVAALPAEFNVDATDPVNSIKSSGYDYIEIGADGNSTHTISMRPYANIGFANATGASGAGDLVENVRVVAYVSETFRTTFSEQPPDITVTTEFSFGEAFEMSIPLTTFPDLVNQINPAPPTPRILTDGRIALPQNLTLRVGSTRFGSMATYASFGYRPPLVETSADAGPALGPNDAFLCLPTENGWMSVFMRGELPTSLAVEYPLPGDTVYQYLARVASTTGEVEVYPLLNVDGSKNLSISYYSPGSLVSFGLIYDNAGQGIRDDPKLYVWKGATVRSVDKSCIFLWPEPSATEDMEAGVEGVFPDGVGVIHEQGTADFVVNGPLGFPQNPNNLENILGVANSISIYTEILEPGTPRVFTLGPAIISKPEDHSYRSLTFSTAPFTANTASGTAAIPDKTTTDIILNAISNHPNIYGNNAFDIVTSSGILVAHAIYDPDGGGFQINIDKDFCYRQFSQPLYIANIGTSTGILQPTPSDSWKTFNTALRTRKLAPREERRQASLAMGVGAGFLGGLGQALNQSNQWAHEKDMAELNYNQNMQLNKQQGTMNYDQMVRNNQMQGDNALNLSSQNFFQNAQLQQQNTKNQALMKGLADPAMLSGVTGDLVNKGPRPTISTPEGKNIFNTPKNEVLNGMTDFINSKMNKPAGKMKMLSSLKGQPRKQGIKSSSSSIPYSRLSDPGPSSNNFPMSQFSNSSVMNFNDALHTEETQV